MSWLSTRESILETGGNVTYSRDYINKIDATLAAATDEIEGSIRRFQPQLNDTLKWRWPPVDKLSKNGYLFFGCDILTIDSITSGGVAIPTDSYTLHPQNQGQGRGDAPYTYMKLKDCDRFIGDVTILGATGFNMTLKNVGVVTTAANTTATDLRLDISTKVGVGSLLKISGEFLTITDRLWTDSGDTLAQTLGSVSAIRSVTLNNPAESYRTGETIRIGDEYLRVESYDPVTRKLVLDRARQGSALQSHDVGSPVWRLNTYVADRGSNGSTAATLTAGTAVELWEPPPMAAALCRGISIVGVQRELSGYGEDIGSGDNNRKGRGGSVSDLWDRTQRRYGRTPGYYAL